MGDMSPIMASKHDVDVLENWEDIEETDVLEKKFDNLIGPSKSNCNSSKDKLETPVKIILTGDDALRTQYVPPEPSVKILKRPSKISHLNGDSKIYQPKKTLQQREQEYAEARLRILGEACPEKIEEKISIQKPKSTEKAQDVIVIRLPRGPDGTVGFKKLR